MPRLAPARPRFRSVLSLLLGTLLGAGGLSAVQMVNRPPLVVGQDAVTDAVSREARVEVRTDSGTYLNITPARGPVNTLLVMYPGGLVRPQAYEWLGRALAVDGVQTVIPAFPVDLAVLGQNRAADLIARYGQGKRVYLAGHSLGGAMAAQYAAKHPQGLRGVLLMGAYPPDNVSLAGTSLQVLSLNAEHDGVVNREKLSASVRQLPPAPQGMIVQVPGAVHSFFGRYGPQKGDGLPTVSRAEAEARMLELIRVFLKR